ncbi:CPBP family intramembrane metalloprotease [Haloterrigena sp. SYSU A558-1]|uniref:CPBP family intramembrane metalloprotease n=1 Tax=Haloterrigena gelatinilytica TaxID=2741724 RepID=A0ABX2LH63_9EURY|nr:CPBP family glutamic-type intramembrane protease [Haloterrigena gelatinilytica]NUC73191.1 CPBP family intramembrane metalloprotease [Haloterrigena gelatinilytica]
MAQWATFAGVTGVVLVLLLVLSHLTQSAFSDDDSTASDGADTASPQSASASSARDDSPEFDSESDRRDSHDPAAPADGEAGGADSSAGADADTDAETAAESESDATADRDGRSAAPDRPTTANDPTTSERAVGPQRTESPSDPARITEPGAHSDGRPQQELDPRSLSAGELLANVALSQGLFASVLLGAVLYTGIPVGALGIEFSTAFLRQGLVLGTAAGLVLYAANEIGAAAATHIGFDHDERLRTLLAPDTTWEWLVLLAFVLPLIAGFEELLFRAALIGALSTGFGVDPWLLAIVSSIAFALGHGMQGSVGILVTGLLGFVLAAVFVVTGSFLVVFVAHYLINALEFVVHEGLEFDWAETLES